MDDLPSLNGHTVTLFAKGSDLWEVVGQIPTTETKNEKFGQFKAIYYKNIYLKLQKSK